MFHVLAAETQPDTSLLSDTDGKGLPLSLTVRKNGKGLLLFFGTLMLMAHLRAP